MLRAPATFAQTVGLFAGLRQDETVESLFARVDWSGVSARQLVHAFLDRPPADAGEAGDAAGSGPAAAAVALFGSGAFRDGLALRILRHFADKQRLLFVHVPKAAGTDFAAVMNRTYPPVSNQLSDAELFPAPQLARRLQNFARMSGDASCVFMAGHTKLSTYLDEGYFRFTDRLVAILRDPNEICVSFANYVMKRFAACPDLSAQDTRAWARALGLTAAQIAGMEPRALGLALVTRPEMQTVNPICSLLGDGTARGTLDNLRRASIEITDTSRYEAWLRAGWGIGREGRINASPQLIGWDDLSGWQQARIAAGNEEDVVVYRAVMERLARTAALSVTGPEVLG